MQKIKRPKILIVDDVPANIKMLREVLKSNYDISFATNGREAIDLLKSGELPDLILLDIMMPEMDGYEVCRTLKSENLTAKIPVIFITSKDDEEDARDDHDQTERDHEHLQVPPIEPPKENAVNN